MLGRMIFWFCMGPVVLVALGYGAMHWQAVLWFIAGGVVILAAIFWLMVEDVSAAVEQVRAERDERSRESPDTASQGAPLPVHAAALNRSATMADLPAWTPGQPLWRKPGWIIGTLKGSRAEPAPFDPTKIEARFAGLGTKPAKRKRAKR